MKAHFDPHSRYRELLAARLDRPLTRAENRLLVSHLKICTECRQAERDYLDQRLLLRSMAQPLPPRDLWARTSTALDREVARWSYRYPRFGRRRVPLGEVRGSRSGAPSALATAVAALGVVTVLAVLQLAPTLRPQPTFNATGSTDGAPLRPTPFAVAPQRIAWMAAGLSDFAVYETQVTQVCPANAVDCFDDDRIVRRSVSLSSNMHPQNVALSPSGNELALVGSDADRDFIGVVMLQARAQPDLPNPPSDPSPSATDQQSSSGPPTETADTGPTTGPTGSGEPPDQPSQEPVTPTIDASPGIESAKPDPSPDVRATADPQTSPNTPVETPVPTAPQSPPGSAIPGLAVLSILEDVHSAGSPPAWSRDGALLAFSAMPSDGRHGPDVYLWAPGDGQAHAITSDHSSFFASWSGRRIVVSRVDEDAGKSDSSLVIRTVVIDPVTFEERVVNGPQMWLPVIDSQRAYAIVWHGSLDRSGTLPVVRSGALYLVDWTALNPFREAATADGSSNPDSGEALQPIQPLAPTPNGLSDAAAAESTVELVPIDPARDPSADPVLDWNVRWSADGRVLGIWEANVLGATWGQLEVVTFDRETSLLDFDNPLIERQIAKRGFSLGVDRVAWVGATDQGTEGELRIQTWGVDGVGELRIRSLEVEELVPAF